MLLRVLGCSGGIGGNLRTTSMLVDHDVLVDAGTGVGDLSLAELQLIDHVLLTHSHLDHVTMLPFLVDTVGGLRDRPIVVHATQATLDILRDHIFNWKVWPDFTRIPDPERAFLRFEPIELGETLELSGGRRFSPVPANHVVPAIGWHLDSGKHSLVFTGDTTVCDALWERVNTIENLRYLIIETAFSNDEKWLAEVSKHLWPDALAAELAKLRPGVRIYVTHLKPGEGAKTMADIEDCAWRFNPHMLSNGHVLRF
jgi:ribonuclease BN (tRNA processing enzyme)